MAKSKQSSNPLALAVLVLLFERPMHPYEIAATLRMRNKGGSIKLRYGSLYTVIDSLAEVGLIRAKETVREGKRPERTIYALTPSGVKRMREWMHELLSTPVKEYPQFEAALSLLPAVPPEEAVALLERACVRLGEMSEELRAAVELAVKHVEALFLVENEYRLSLHRCRAAVYRRTHSADQGLTQSTFGPGKRFTPIRNGRKSHESVRSFHVVIAGGGHRGALPGSGAEKGRGQRGGL